MNPEIISEIKYRKNIPEKTREFLLWLIEFERARMDRDRIPFQEEIQKAAEKYNK